MKRNLIGTMILYASAFLVGYHAKSINTLYFTLALYVVFDLVVIRFLTYITKVYKIKI